MPLGIRTSSSAMVRWVNVLKHIIAMRKAIQTSYAALDCSCGCVQGRSMQACLLWLYELGLQLLKKVKESLCSRSGLAAVRKMCACLHTLVCLSLTSLGCAVGVCLICSMFRMVTN